MLCFKNRAIKFGCATIRAAEAAAKAEAASDSTLKADYLASIDSWMLLARSYEFNDRITDFTAAVSQKQVDGLATASRQRDDARLLQEISTLLIQAGDINALYERIIDGAIILMSSDMAIFKYSIRANRCFG